MSHKGNALDIIDRLKQAIETTLSAVIPPGPLALVDFPNHPNVGDSAIWLGEIAYIQKDRSVSPAYCCSIASYSEGDLKAAVPSGAILIHGGGNFGTIWRDHQDFRLELLARFPDRPIIQLPQSIHFSNESSIAETARAIDAHGAFTLLVRDQKSLDFARNRFDCPVHLCPDSAFYLGPARRMRPEADLLYLLRTDVEQAGEHRIPDTTETRIVTDWLGEPRYRRRLGKLTGVTRGILAGGRANTLKREIFNASAWARYRRGVEILSRGRVVITDRLHAHIVSLLLDIPNVTLDNSYGKLGSFIEAWTKDYNGLRRAANVETAVNGARELLSLARDGAACVVNDHDRM